MKGESQLSSGTSKRNKFGKGKIMGHTIEKKERLDHAALSSKPKRGRPPKYQQSIKPAGKRGRPSKYQQSIAPAGKRGRPLKYQQSTKPDSKRGRPPKYQQSTKPAGKRGRPSKYQQSIEPAVKRGRPPKHRLHNYVEIAQESKLNKKAKRFVPLTLNHGLAAAGNNSSSIREVKSLTSPRLRRLGVRQAEDAHSYTSTPNSSNESNHEIFSLNQSTELMRRFGFDDSMVPPTDRQLQRMLSSQISQYQSHVKQQKLSQEDLSSVKVDAVNQKSILRCPECGKVFLSYHGYATHVESHPNSAVRCSDCRITFVSNRSLVMHQRLRHNRKSEDQDHDTQLGFHKITFIDFSCLKFPKICRFHCETNSTRSAGLFHDFQCSECDKSFPMQLSLDQHLEHHHMPPSKYICKQCEQDYRSKLALDSHKKTATRHRLTDAKRQYLHSISLLPSCFMDSIQPEKPYIKVNEMYYRKLKTETEVSVLNYYESVPSVFNYSNESPDEED